MAHANLLIAAESEGALTAPSSKEIPKEFDEVPVTDVSKSGESKHEKNEEMLAMDIPHERASIVAIHESSPVHL